MVPGVRSLWDLAVVEWDSVLVEGSFQVSNILGQKKIIWSLNSVGNISTVRHLVVQPRQYIATDVQCFPGANKH